jgi:2-polyprenyl-3-methyl-5-hydroxy-6-metoxy-1,4-benzoquinol methylase
MAALEPHKQAEIDSHARDMRERPAIFHKPFGAEWNGEYWAKWAVIAYALRRLGVAEDAELLDIGCGPGWTSLFLAEEGYSVTGVDLAPAHVEVSTQRAQQRGIAASFETHDMDYLALDRRFDAVLVFDALHHSTRQRAVIRNIADHLRPGGWVLFGEPSWLHNVSPGARRVHRERGWTERGVGVRALRRDCHHAGLVGCRRFYEGTNPYESRHRGFGWQLVRLVAANFFLAPQMSVWLAAQKPDAGARHPR